MKTIHIDKLKKLGKKLYPDYRGRKFGVSFRKDYWLQDHWNEGTRHYVRAIKIEGNDIKVMDHFNFNPLSDTRAHQTFIIPKDVFLVERTIFQGHEIGITFIFPTEGGVAVTFPTGEKKALVDLI